MTSSLFWCVISCTDQRWFNVSDQGSRINGLTSRIKDYTRWRLSFISSLQLSSSFSITTWQTPLEDGESSCSRKRQERYFTKKKRPLTRHLKMIPDLWKRFYRKNVRWGCRWVRVFPMIKRSRMMSKLVQWLQMWLCPGIQRGQVWSWPQWMHQQHASRKFVLFIPDIDGMLKQVPLWTFFRQ